MDELIHIVVARPGRFGHRGLERFTFYFTFANLPGDCFLGVLVDVGVDQKTGQPSDGQVNVPDFTLNPGDLTAIEIEPLLGLFDGIGDERLGVFKSERKSATKPFFQDVLTDRRLAGTTVDAYMWQALETKARFIGQVITGDNAARRAEDIGGQELSYAEVKAIASGNPAVLTLAEADAELQRLALLKKNHLDEQYVARRSVRDLPGIITSQSEWLSKLSADEATATAHAADPIAIGGRTYPREDIPGTLSEKLDAVPRNVRETTRVPLGSYRGLRFGIVTYAQFPPEVYLEGATTREAMLSREHQGPRAVLNAVERLAGEYGSECDRVKQNIAIAEGQLRDNRARLGKPFTLDAYLSELTALRDQLKAGLSVKAPEGNTGPSIPELADRIKALKAANSIEATPQRVRQKHSTAEEPIIHVKVNELEVMLGGVLLDGALLVGDGLLLAVSRTPEVSDRPRGSSGCGLTPSAYDPTSHLALLVYRQRRHRTSDFTVKDH